MQNRCVEGITLITFLKTRVTQENTLGRLDRQFVLAKECEQSTCNQRHVETENITTD